jgi:hypothetical protein
LVVWIILRIRSCSVLRELKSELRNRRSLKTE